MPEFKFKENSKPREGFVIDAYQHVDNGGYKVRVTKYGGIEFEASFYGYITINLQLHDVNLDNLIEILQLAKKRIEEQNIVDKLKGK
jgi:hypothetical protein